mmetsp:Transcript_138630/g.276444  ORF Transcript_138630/g.276444 Transcript_138630/m.276444 type:complete len:305 (+) Transcript_138630:66-980(+)
MEIAHRKLVNERRRGSVGMGFFVAGIALVVLGNLRSGGHGRGQGSDKDVVMPEAFFGLRRMQAAQTADEAFGGAMSGDAVMSKALWPLWWKYGMGRKNTIYAQSLCADEINSDNGHLGRLLTEYYYGRVFPLGGIGGAPYGGKTGFGAFSHHVPDGGNVFVLFGPHIGFSPKGEPGKFLRSGQKKLSTSCGALCAAYKQCTSGSMPADPKDMEQTWLREKLGPKCKDIKESSNPMVELALQAYKVIEEEILSIVNTGFGTGNLVLLGGIQINMPYGMPGFFKPMHFSIRAEGREPENLMSVFER